MGTWAGAVTDLALGEKAALTTHGDRVERMKMSPKTR